MRDGATLIFLHLSCKYLNSPAHSIELIDLNNSGSDGLSMMPVSDDQPEDRDWRHAVALVTPPVTHNDAGVTVAAGRFCRRFG
jgi:hypothetical protein